MVCDYEYDENRMRLKINCLGCVFGSSIEDFEECMARTIDKILEVKKVNSIVLVKNREYEYGPEQTRLLVEIAEVIENLIREKIISKKNMGPEWCDKYYPERVSTVQHIVIDLARRDPIGAYVETVREIRHVNMRIKREFSEKKRQCLEIYRDSVLEVIRKKFEATKLIQMVKDRLAGYHIGDRSLYREIFMPSVRPNFMLTRFMITPPKDGRSIDRYKV
ncbi:MAG: hypothetical protein DRP15_03560, partial [Candidatus Aenigmatarchaeota archaeon]